MAPKRPFIRWIPMVLAVVLTAALIVPSLLPPGVGPRQHGWEKWGHALAYGTLVLAWWAAMPGLLGPIAWRWPLILGLCGGAWVLGFGVELIQPYFHRDLSGPDLAANTVGIGVAAAMLAGARVFR